MNKGTKVQLVLFAFVLSVLSCTQKKVEPKNVEISSLKNSFKNSFYVGSAINGRHIDGSDSLGVDLIRKEFNTITPENIMKWMHIHPQKDTFNFDQADKYVALGEMEKMFIVGHTLVWHSQIADWVNEVKDSTVMASLLENHITRIVKRYRGRIHAWDVVNEALNEDGSLRESLFLKVMGQSYLEHAFKMASIADPDAELLYNDYNLTNPEKRAGAIRLIKGLQASGAKIDGVGMQGHWNLKGPSLEEIEESILAYSELGLKISVTELDITVLPNPWDLEGAEVDQNFEGSEFMNPYPDKFPDSVKLKLAKRYEDIFKIFLKHEDKISRITFWGVTDGNTWLNNWPIKGRTNYPLLFDRQYRHKMAYDSVMQLKKN